LTVSSWVGWVDPCGDPQAEPVTAPQTLALLGAVSTAAFLFLRWKFQPMQDLGHHVAMTAVAADWGREGSLYTSLYLPLDPLAANSLLYSVAGVLGRAVGATWAVRLCLLSYVVGLPLAVAWALRARGRSIWPAVASSALLFQGVFVAGFANLLLAGPLLVVSVVVYARMLEEPSRRRIVACTVLFTLVFLAHVHVFLWLGVLCLALFVRALALRLRGRNPAAPSPWSLLLASTVAAGPALLLFARWYGRTFGPPRRGFGAIYMAPADVLLGIPSALQSLRSRVDLWLLGALLVLCVVALLAQRLAPPRDRVLELACLLTFLSYFALPEWLRGHDNVASRQPSMALWFLPVLLSPVAVSVSPVMRRIVVGGVLVYTAVFLGVWGMALAHFERDEVAGLPEVLDAAPWRSRLHMVKLDPDSRYFTGHPLWHVEKYVMGDKLGQTPDTSGINATSPIRYREGVPIHRITVHSQDWPSNEEIWTSFDVVLVRRWRPSPDQLARAEARGRLLRKAGDWELWATRP
jgi:hypothetical protein